MLLVILHGDDTATFAQPKRDGWKTVHMLKKKNGDFYLDHILFLECYPYNILNIKCYFDDDILQYP